MEKSAYNPNYPQMPPQMMPSSSQAAGDPSTSDAPPSYDQATGSGYPPVQVLPSNQEQNFAQPQQQQQQQPQQQSQYQPQPQYHHPQQFQPQPAHRHNPPVATVGSTTYYAASAGSPPMVQQPMVIIHQQAIVPLGPEPSFVTCPACHIQKLTRVEHEPTSQTHLMAALLCILGLWCCVCLPYCARSCMTTNHYCGNCNKFLGSYGKGL